MGKGSCFCGNVTYEITGEPAMGALCHCLECRKVSGSAFTTNVLIPDSNFQIVGPIKSYSKKHESGMSLNIFFCENCGSTLYKTGTAEAFKDLAIVQAGSLDEPGLKDVKLEAELYVKHRADWVGEKDGLAQCQTFT